jgi:glycine reductase
MADRVRVVHYLNQFFAGVGGEEAAGVAPSARDGAVGPGRLLQQILGADGEVVGTVSGGDIYMAERPEEAAAEAVRLIAGYDPDVVVAGPAFDAGRYGVACGAVCRAVQRELGRPAVAAMAPANPAAPLYRDIYVVPSGTSAAAMAQALPPLARLAIKLARGEPLGPAEEEGYLPRGIRRRVMREQPAALRAVEMLVARMWDRPFVSEVPVLAYESVPPAPPVGDLAHGTIALVTSGGIVPRGNPDRLVSGGARDWFRYSIADLPALTVGDWESVHGGFSTVVLNTHNPNYAMPLHLLRELERAGEIAGIYPWFFSTVGNGTAVLDAKRFGAQMAEELRAHGVVGALLVAT